MADKPPVPPSAPSVAGKGRPRVRQADPPVTSSSNAQPTILDANAFTHGGVPKAKFVPKVPGQRKRKITKAKREAEDKSDLESSKDLINLVEQSKEPFARRFGADKKSENVRVAFGYGGSGSSNRASVFIKGGIAGEQRKAKASGSSQGGIGAGDVLTNIDDDYVEPFDYTTNYPITLPLRKPFSGKPELLDEQEFGERSTNEFDESEIIPAEELDLWTETADDRIMFFQLPASLPLRSMHKTKNEKGGTRNAGKSSDGQGSHKVESSGIGKLQAGHMGKLLIYESGAVKLHLGDVVLNAAPGAECIFAQDVAAINSATKKCCFFNNVDKQVTLVPDIDSLLSNSLHID